MSTPDTSTLPDNELDPRRWQALALVSLAFFMTVQDGTIVTVAVPLIKSSPAQAAMSGFVLGFWVLAGISAVSLVAFNALVRGREFKQTTATSLAVGGASDVRRPQ